MSACLCEICSKTIDWLELPVSDSALESQVCDDPSRIELQRLDLVLSGGKRRFYAVHLALAFAPMLIPILLARFRWFVFSNIHYILPIALIVVAVALRALFYRWREYEARAAAIRAGASFAAPVILKDHNIFLLSALFMGLFAGVLADETLIPPSDFTRIGRVFLFIAAVVFALWSLGKAIIGYRICPPAHLRRRDLLGGIYGGIFMLLFLGVGATLNSSLPVVIDFFVSRTTPNYLTPAKP